MIYKFVIVSDEADNFKLQIAIDSTATFMQLRNIILDSAGYSKEQMDSFYICDDEWNKEKEVTCMDMGSDSDEDIWIMDDTQLDELLEDEGQRMKFVFDYMTERFFKVKLKEVVPGKSLLGQHGLQHGNVAGNVPGRILKDGIQKPFKGTVCAEAMDIM
jgi:hypothetical protein